MRFNAVYRRLYFWLGSALVALMDAPPLHPMDIVFPLFPSNFTIEFSTLNLTIYWGVDQFIICNK